MKNHMTTERTCRAEGGDRRRRFIVATTPFLELIVSIQLANHLFGQTRERTVCMCIDEGEKNVRTKIKIDFLFDCHELAKPTSLGHK